MKIAMIHGQNHRGSTYHISKQLAEKMISSEDQLTEYFLPDDGPGYCIGCYQCFEQGEEHCPHYSPMKRITEELDASDLVIISSPTYCLAMTGQLKTFFDHLAYRWMSHRPKKEMFVKRAIVVSTTAGAGAKKVTKSIANQLFWLGVSDVRQLAVKVQASSWEAVPEKIKREIDGKVAKLSRKIKNSSLKGSPSLRLKLTFALMGQMHDKNDWNPMEREYWEEHGWLAGEKPWKQEGTTK